ncbi:MAG: DNA translocase FtsK [Acidobacteriota bacterium]
MTEMEQNRKLRERIREIRFGLQELLIALSTERHIYNDAQTASEDFFEEIVESNHSAISEELYHRALALITDLGYASTLVLQTRLEISYQQALNLVAALERSHLIAPAHGFRPHKVLPAAYELRERLESGELATARV